MSSDQSETVIFGRFCLLIEEQARVCTLQVITDELKGESTSNRDRTSAHVYLNVWNLKNYSLSRLRTFELLST